MARVQADATCPIFGSSEGCSLAHDVKIGEFGNGLGITISKDPAGNTMGLMAVYPELKSTDAVLAAGAVCAGYYSRFLINKAQTNDVSCFGAELQCRVKAGTTNGCYAGAWLYWEQSGTTTNNGECMAAMCTVESESTLTAAQLSGVQISSAVHASATVTTFAAIRIATNASAKPWDYLVYATGTGAPAVAVMRLTAVSGVVERTGTASNQAGAFKVLVDGNTHYVPFYTTFS
jgi:hypothetical protein